MPLPLFFHLAIILRRKLELVKLLPSTLPVLDSYRPHTSTHRLPLVRLQLTIFPSLLIQPPRHLEVVFLWMSG